MQGPHGQDAAFPIVTEGTNPRPSDSRTGASSQRPIQAETILLLPAPMLMRMRFARFRYLGTPKTRSGPSLSWVVCHERRLSTTVRNCARDGGGPSGVGSQVLISSHRSIAVLSELKSVAVKVVVTMKRPSLA